MGQQVSRDRKTVIANPRLQTRDCKTEALNLDVVSVQHSVMQYP